MVENEFVTREDAASAMQEPIKTRPLSGVDGADAPYFVEEVRRQLVDRYGSDAFYSGGYSVRTTIDPQLQKTADRAIIEGLEALDKRQGWRGPLGHMETLDESLSAYLSSFGKDMHNGRFPALVTGVTEREARIIVMTSRDPDEPGLVRGVIPFSLADWAYPPRNKDGIRPPPLTKMTNALNRNDVIMVQRPDDVPDRLARMLRQKGSIPDYEDNVWALGQIPQVQRCADGARSPYRSGAGDDRRLQPGDE